MAALSGPVVGLPLRQLSSARSTHLALCSNVLRRSLWPMPGTTSAAAAARLSLRGSLHVSASSSERPFERPREVAKVKVAQAHGGGGVKIWGGGISRADYDLTDPFLMLDEAMISPPGGFPDHPHRGFETVTYVIDGAMSHEDFEGHSGILNSGDVQWMTAGKGILHSELPVLPQENHGTQLWVNLPAKYKMCEPNYQEMADQEIPRGRAEGVEVKVIAGEALGASSPVRTLNPTMYLDFTLQPGAEGHQPVSTGWNVFCYVLAGAARFAAPDAPDVGPHSSVLFGPAGGGVSAWNRGGEACRFLLLAGQPIREPVAQYGPFVMNTQEEVNAAIRDYQMGVNGFEKAAGWTASRSRSRSRAAGRR